MRSPGPKATRHPKILRVPFDREEPSDLDTAMTELDAALRANNEAAARRVLFGFVAAQATVETERSRAQGLAGRAEAFESEAQSARPARALH